MTRRFAYLDSCILIPLFIEEAGSSAAERAVMEFTHGGELPVLLSELTCLEFHSVVSRHFRTGLIALEQARRTLDAFDRQCDAEFMVLPVQASHFQTARGWISDLSTSLRTFDALHLAVARGNGCTLLTADRQLASAADILHVDCHLVGC